MFDGFTARDFDAYARPKWRSNVYTRDRLEVKQKLMSLGREISGRLTSADGAPLLCEASVEHPALWNQKQVDAQHLYFSRNAEARKELDRIIDRDRPMAVRIEDPSPQTTHAFVALSVYFDRLESAVRVHPDATVDRNNLRKKLADARHREQFVDLVRELDDRYEIGIEGGLSFAAPALTDASLTELLDSMPAGSAASAALPMSLIAPAQLTPWLFVRTTVARDEALGSADAIRDHIVASLEALLPIYQFLAWSRDNDFVSMRDQLKREITVKRQRGLAKNDRVRIVSGMFAGRLGVVQDVDGKGTVKLLVEKMPIKVRAEDVEKT